MKKVIFGKKDKKQPKPPKPNAKSKSKSKPKPNVVLPTLFTVEEPMLAKIQPFDIEDEREYLKEILKDNKSKDVKLTELEDYNYIRIHLTHFGNLFPNIKFKKPENPDDPLIEEKYNGPKYKQVIDLIIPRYKDVKLLKYFIRLFLNQYGLTLEDFYNKFLQNPVNFLELRELRKLFLKILKQHDRLTPDKLDSLDNEPELVDLDINLIKAQLEEFILLYPKYKKSLENLLENFDLTLMIKFITEFLNQSHQYLHEFYGEFIKDIKIKVKINEIKNKHNTIEETPIKVKPAIQQFKYGDNLNPEELKKCIALYMSVPWIPQKVEKVYIAKVDTDIEELKLMFKEPFNFNGKEWFRINKKYYELQCSTKFNKVQKGDVLNFNDKNTGSLIKNFIVGYGIIEAGKKVKKDEVSKIIIQNEDVYNKEQEFIKQYNKTDEEKLSYIPEEPIKPDIEKLAIDILTQNMKITRKINKEYIGPRGNIINNIEDETTKIADVQYIKDIVDKIAGNSENVKEFIDKLGQIVVYITPDVDFVTFGIFKTSIEMNNYTPENLISLTQKEKMPEIFTDKYLPPGDIEKIQKLINSDLENAIAEFKEDFIDTVYIRRNPFTRYKQKNRSLNRRFNKEYFPEDWRLKCENIYDKKREIDKVKLSKIPINAIGFYLNYTDPEDNKTYCLNIYEIGERIENNDNTNPYTDKPLSLDFVENVKKILISKKKKERVIEEEIPIEKIHIGHLAPGLLEIIRNDINRLIDLKTSINIDSGPQEDGYNERMSYLNDEIDEIYNSEGYSYDEGEYFDDGIENEDGNYEQEDEDANDKHEKYDGNYDYGDDTHEKYVEDDYGDGTHRKYVEDDYGDDTHGKYDGNDDYGDNTHEKYDGNDDYGDNTHEKYDGNDDCGDDTHGKYDGNADCGDDTHGKYDGNDDYGDNTREKYDGNDDDIQHNHMTLDKYGEDGNDKYEEDADDNYTIDDTDDDSVIEVSDFEYGLDCEIPEICRHCSNDILHKKYKSTLWNDNKGIDNVVFCSIKCIEKFDWKKYKCKIKCKNKI